jgi:hypothetical protein
MQNAELFEGDIIGIPTESSFRRMHDDVDEARIFGQPVSRLHLFNKFNSTPSSTVHWTSILTRTNCGRTDGYPTCSKKEWLQRKCLIVLNGNHLCLGKEPQLLKHSWNTKTKRVSNFRQKKSTTMIMFTSRGMSHLGKFFICVITGNSWFSPVVQIRLNDFY